MKPHDNAGYKTPPISIDDETNCHEKTLGGILMVLQKCLSMPKPIGFEDSILQKEPDSMAFKD